MKENRWDCQSVFCIKEYKTIKSGGYYLIKGRGDLEFNCDPEINDRKGYGFCIEDSFYGSFSGRKDWWNYFSEEEMSEYFISEEEDLKAYLRNDKLNQLGVY
jgi:hypothetical protein